ncbi:MAG: hypothetical protein ACWGNV_10495, partial [Bacteroidales bacterium]
MGNPHKHKYVRMLLLVLSVGTGALVQGWSQESRFQVIDQVDLPEALGGGMGVDLPEALGGRKGVDLPEAMGEGAGSTRYLEFRESWIFMPDRPSLLKNTAAYILRDTQDTTISSDDLLAEFGERVRRLPLNKGRVQIDGVRYEFILLDPHLVGSGLEGYQVPDS